MIPEISIFCLGLVIFCTLSTFHGIHMDWVRSLLPCESDLAIWHLVSSHRMVKYLLKCIQLPCIKLLNSPIFSQTSMLKQHGRDCIIEKENQNVTPTPSHCNCAGSLQSHPLYLFLSQELLHFITLQLWALDTKPCPSVWKHLLWPREHDTASHSTDTASHPSFSLTVSHSVLVAWCFSLFPLTDSLIFLLCPE